MVIEVFVQWQSSWIMSKSRSFAMWDLPAEVQEMSFAIPP
jgi:hypothetical protein